MDLQNTQADPEAAKYAELEKELGDWADEADQAPAKQAETEPKAADPESKKEAQPEPEKAKPDFEVLERNYKNVQGALSEARGEARSLKEQFQAQQKQLEALQDFLRQTVGRQQQDDEEGCSNQAQSAAHGMQPAPAFEQAARFRGRQIASGFKQTMVGGHDDDEGEGHHGADGSPDEEEDPNGLGCRTEFHEVEQHDQHLQRRDAEDGGHRETAFAQIFRSQKAGRFHQPDSRCCDVGGCFEQCGDATGSRYAGAAGNA